MKMNSKWVAVACASLASACVIQVNPGDDELGDTTSESGTSESTSSDGDTTTGDTTTSDGESTTGDTTTGDTTTGDTTTGDTTTGAGDCVDPAFVDFFSLAISLDGEPIGANLDLDLGCTVLADNSLALVLDCGQFELVIDHQGEVSAAIPDPEGSTVALRLITDDAIWGLGQTWLRIDFIGMSKSVFLIDALTLAPITPTSWVAPWGLALVDECAAIDDGCGEWVGQTLGVARDGQTLELLQGGSGSIAGGSLQMWVEAAWRYQTIGPACDAPDSHTKLAIVSDNLVESEVCTPGEMDPCGTGLECCYPCGIPDCDFVCTPEDPQTLGCPPPPP